MTVYELLCAQLIVLTGAVVQGSIGFGFSLISVPFLALIDLKFVPGPVICAATVLSILTAGRELKSVDLPGIKWAVVGRIPGIALAILLLRAVSEQDLKMVVGGLVVAAVALSLNGLQVRITKRSLAGAGFFSGFMGTSAAIGGPPLALLFQHKSGDYLRGTLAGYFIISAVMSLTALTLSGWFGWREVYSGALLLPGVLIGFGCSNFVKSRITGTWLRLAVLLISGSAGLGLVLKSF